MSNNDVLEIARKEEVRGLAGRGIKKLLNDIVRCKNCKHWKSTTTKEKDTCLLLCMYNYSPDFFCAFGEKREDDDE